MTDLRILDVPDISKFIKWSIAMHVAVVAFFSVKAYFAPEVDLSYQNAIRVNVVDLPDKKVEEALPTQKEELPPNLPKNAEEKPVPPKPAKKEKLSKKDPKTTALDRLKALQAIEENLAQEEGEKKKKKIEDLKKGNVLSPGTQIAGLQKVKYDQYLSQLDTHLKQNWALPEWLAKSKLKAKVKVRFDRRGNLIEKVLLQSSSNSTYDELALNAVEKASPFPPPPEVFVNIVEVDGIVVGFPE